LAKSGNAEEKVASPMWYDAQQKWREYVMRAAAPTSNEYLTLGAANSAYRQLLSLEKALRASGGERINPRNLAKSLDSAGINSGDLYKISKSMNATLPGTVPDSGTAGRLAFQALPLTLGLGGAGMGIPALVGAGVGAAAFGTQTGTKALTGQLATQKYMSDLLRNKLKVSDPAMLSSQLGRASATRGE
jgi:hypothetical protein